MGQNNKPALQAHKYMNRKSYSLWPNEPCHKCANKVWFVGDYFEWKCPICGNRVYYTYSTFVQQIDIVMSSHRRHEYVYSVDKKTILPKKNEFLKRMKLQAELEKVKKKRKKKK